MTGSHPRHQAGDPIDLALVDNAVHRAEGLAVADPIGGVADEVAAELSGSRDVLADSIRHARSVYEDQAADAFTNPTARLYLLAGACRLLKNAMVPPW
ncbi:MULTISPECIES: hypothetical protein [unclassified Streptomyces]|uniref:hypothetical protein n=1 Tax=unclassified Streptomyces TaxID=2593676 RepID=UPI0033C4EB9B